MTINPNNYKGISATIVGYAAGDAEFPAYDKGGERGISEVRVPIGHGYKDKSSGEWKETGTTWVTVTGRTDDIGHIRKGDLIRVDDGKFESREFTRKDGSIGQAFQTSFGMVTVLESRADEDKTFKEDEPF